MEENIEMEDLEIKKSPKDELNLLQNALADFQNK